MVIILFVTYVLVTDWVGFPFGYVTVTMPDSVTRVAHGYVTFALLERFGWLHRVCVRYHGLVDGCDGLFDCPDSCRYCLFCVDVTDSGADSRDYHTTVTFPAIPHTQLLTTHTHHSYSYHFPGHVPGHLHWIVWVGPHYPHPTTTIPTTPVGSRWSRSACIWTLQDLIVLDSVRFDIDITYCSA